MDVVARHLPGHDFQLVLCGNLPQQVAHTNRYLVFQHRLAILRHPHQMNLQVALRVRAQPVMSHATTTLASPEGEGFPPSPMGTLKSGKRHDHQRRIPKRLLEQVETKLQAIRRKLSNATDFDVLHRLVEQEIGGIRGIGALMVYDISHRIGAYFGKAPERVYLHAGVRVGAPALGQASREGYARASAQPQ